MKKLFTILFALCAPMLFAQSGDLDDEIVITANYKPVLADAVKVKILPEIPDKQIKADSQQYDVPEKYLAVPYEAPDVRPLVMATEPPDPVPNVFAKIGAGNRALPYLEIYANSGLHNQKRAESNRTMWAAHAGYINAGGKLENQAYSELRTSFDITRYFEPVALSGGVLFDHDIVHFYGYDNDSFSFPGSEVRQVFQTLGANVGLKNSQQNDAHIDHDTRLKFTYTSDRFNQSEINPKFSTAITKELDNKNRILGKMLLDYTGFSSDSTQRNQFIAGFNPAFRLQRDVWHAQAGINTGVDDIGFFFFPDLGFERQLAGKDFVIYAGWNGAPKNNGLKSFSSVNPFIAADPTMLTSREQDRFIGFKGNPAPSFSYNFKFSNKQVRNMPLFVVDTTDGRTFNVTYDSVTLINQLHGEIGIGHGEKVRVTLSGDFLSFALSNQAHAWHIPTLQGKLNTAVQATPRLRFSADLFAFNNTMATDETGQLVRLPGTVDINIGSTFKMSSSFFIFVSVNNVASIQHQRWYNYPGYGLNVVGGLGLSF